MLFGKNTHNRPALRPVDICLLVDNSKSEEKFFNDIDTSVAEMIESIKTSDTFKGLDAYFTLITFSDDFSEEKNVITDFTPIGKISAKPLVLSEKYSTNPIPALRYAVNHTLERVRNWREEGRQPYCPMIYFFTDGVPFPANTPVTMPDGSSVKTLGEAFIDEANDIKDHVTNGRLLFVCAGFGQNADIDLLKLLTHDEFVIDMKDNDTEKLKRFFRNLIPQTPCSDNGFDSEKKLINQMFHTPGPKNKNGGEN